MPRSAERLLGLLGLVLVGATAIGCGTQIPVETAGKPTVGVTSTAAAGAGSSKCGLSGFVFSPGPEGTTFSCSGQIPLKVFGESSVLRVEVGGATMLLAPGATATWGSIIVAVDRGPNGELIVRFT